MYNGPFSASPESLRRLLAVRRLYCIRETEPDERPAGALMHYARAAITVDLIAGRAALPPKRPGGTVTLRTIDGKEITRPIRASKQL